MLPATIPSTYNEITVSRKGGTPGPAPVVLNVGSGNVRRLTPDNAKALAAALLEAAETPKTKADRIREILSSTLSYPDQRTCIRSILNEDGPL